MPLDGFAKRFKGLWIGILCGELPQLIKAIDELKSVLAYVMELGPKPVEFGNLRRVQHQPAQMVIFAVKERQSNNFGGGDYFGVTKCGREQLAKVVESRVD